MSRKVSTVAIVGRTNVGKTTLFNAIIGKRVGIVEDYPGVTRDRHAVIVSRFERPFILVDTGGLVGEEDSSLHDEVRAQAEVAIEEADLILAVFDGISGPHPLDRDVVDLLRRSEKPILWVVNKCEKDSTSHESSEFYSLGIESLFKVSAVNKRGIQPLVEAILEALPNSPLPTEESSDVGIRVAIVGRPNVGKSTFINKLIGEKRLVTAPEAGTTRDSIDVSVSQEGDRFILVDTAGLRKKPKVDDGSVERFSNLRTLQTVAECDVAVVMVDASRGAPSDQDKKIASLVHERGKGLIIAINKWDLVEKNHKSAVQYKKQTREAFRFCPYAPILFLSARTGRRCQAVLEKASEVYKEARKKIPTSRLNRVFNKAFENNPPPVSRGMSVRLFFSTQIAESPPTFVLFVNNPRAISDPYERYLKRALREEFPFEGTDVRLIMRRKSNKGDVERKDSVHSDS